MHHQLNEEGPADDDEGEDGVPSYRELLLPAAELAGQWEVLHYDRCGVRVRVRVGLGKPPQAR